MDSPNNFHVIIGSFISQPYWSGAECRATTRIKVIWHPTKWLTLSSAWEVVRSNTLTNVCQWTTRSCLDGVTLITLPVPMDHHRMGIFLTTLSNAIFAYTKVSIILGYCFDLLCYLARYVIWFLSINCASCDFCIFCEYIFFDSVG